MLAFVTTGAQAEDINTRIGKIETVNGFPTAEAALLMRSYYGMTQGCWKFRQEQKMSPDIW